jgi:hypothetical protein
MACFISGIVASTTLNGRGAFPGLGDFGRSCAQRLTLAQKRQSRRIAILMARPILQHSRRLNNAAFAFGSGPVWLVGAGLFTIFVKGAGLYAPDWNRFAGQIELRTGKPAPLNPTRVRHPKFETPTGLNHPVNHKENLNDRNLTRYASFIMRGLTAGRNAN